MSGLVHVHFFDVSPIPLTMCSRWMTKDAQFHLAMKKAVCGEDVFKETGNEWYCLG